VDDQVLITVHDERRLVDRLEVVVGALALDALFRDRLSLPTLSFTSGSRST
jgi:hypothetical protein